jgi:hypothetical protein
MNYCFGLPPSRIGASRLMLGVAAVIAASCAAQLPLLQRRETLSTSVGSFTVEYSDADSSALPAIAHAVEAAGTPIGRWGELQSLVRIQLLPSHELLEQAVNRPGYEWLRAWARYDEVFIQSPRSWGFIGPTQGEINELLTHELTHCMMYQQSSDRDTWSEKEFPLWFREGMASYTAGQGYRWPTSEELARFLETHPKEDPIARADGLYRNESDIVYSAAHHAFVYLVQRYGEAGIRDIFHAMRPGPSFSEAFVKVTDQRAEDFTEEFKSFLLRRGFQPPARAHSQSGAR